MFIFTNNKFLITFLISTAFTVLLLLLQLESSSGLKDVLKRFDYKYSFKGPYLAQPDGTIPFWERRGNALPSDHSIRVTPSLRRQSGALWSKNKTTFEWWEVDLVFRISGRGRTGGDGLAFWYLEQKPGEGVTGSVFGGMDGPWTGLLILWDSYDNDGKFDNPVIMGINNKGTLVYDHAKDGENQHFGHCLKDYRNKPFPLRAKIRYHKRALSLYFNNGMNKGEFETDFELCFQSFNVELPLFGYFGITASTANVADDQDIFKFLTSSIKEVPMGAEENGKEREKLEKEFQTYQEKHTKQKEEYKQQHPEHETKQSDDVDDEYLDELYDKEFKKVIEEQQHTHTSVLLLTKQLEDILAKHETISSAISSFQNSGKEGSESLGTRTAPLQRFEVDNILASNKELLSLSTEIIKLANLIEEKVREHENHQMKPQAQIPGIPSNDPNTIIDEVTNEIINLQSGVKSVLSKMEVTPGPTECSSLCVSTKMYVIFSSISTMAILSYLIFKDHSSTYASKKFY